MKLLLWAFKNPSLSDAFIVKPILQVVNLSIKFDRVVDLNAIRHIYELLLSRITNITFSQTVASILADITTKTDIDARRCKFVRKWTERWGPKHSLNSLRWRYRQLRPDLEPHCPLPTSQPPVDKSCLYLRFIQLELLVGDGFLSELGWESGQLATRVVFKDSQKKSLLPTAETLNLESGLKNRINTKIPLSHFKSVEDAFENVESLQLPNNLLAVLSTKVGPVILPRRELVERFSLLLYFTLSKEFFSPPAGRSKKEMELREKRQKRFLEILIIFQSNCYHGLPVAGRYDMFKLSFVL